MIVDPKDQILARMYSVLTLLCLLPMMVVGQVVWVYLTEGAELQARGERQARSTVTIPAMRGTLLDRAGRALATNTARYDLALDPTIQGFTEKQDTFFERLSALTGTSVPAYRRRVRERSSPQYVRLVRGLDEPQAEAIEDWDIPGLILTPRFARRYNYGTTAAHVLGHVNSDGTGIAGLEMEYDNHLQGTDGWRAVKRDRRGHIEAFVGGQVVEPKHGQNLVLTVDLVRQTILEDELRRGIEASGAAWGTARAPSSRWPTCRRTTRTALRPPPMPRAATARSPIASSRGRRSSSSGRPLQSSRASWRWATPSTRATDGPSSTGAR
jgi:cell division protein FtsI (penicillin-binding protein 3)